MRYLLALIFCFIASSASAQTVVVRHYDLAPDGATRPVIVMVDGSPWRVERHLPTATPLTQIATNNWFAANVSLAQRAAWSADAAANVATGVVTPIPEGWGSFTLTDAEVRPRIRAAINATRIEMNANFAALLTGMVSAGVITQPQADAILPLITTTRPEFFETYRMRKNAQLP